MKVVPEWTFSQDDPKDEWVHVIYKPADKDDDQDKDDEDTDKGGTDTDGKKGDTADTGDRQNVALWFGLLGAAFAALLAGFMQRRKKN